MPRSYTHLTEFEDKLAELYEAGKTRQEIADEFGLTKTQVKNWVYRYHLKQRNMENGISSKKRGRPRKYDIPLNMNNPLQVIEYQEKQIKRLEMENELLRDFLYISGKE